MALLIGYKVGNQNYIMVYDIIIITCDIVAKVYDLVDAMVIIIIISSNSYSPSQYGVKVFL